MAELAISRLIKIILGVAVFVTVVIALYFFFRDKINAFFSGLGGIFWSLI